MFRFEKEGILPSMRWYPLCLDIRDSPCLVVGGGAVALAKARSLHRAGARLIVVAPDRDKGFDALEGLVVRSRAFEPADAAGMRLAMAATDVPEVNRAVAAACADHGVWCCVADQPETGDFIVPASIERGALMVMVASSGAAPAFTRRLRRELEAWLPEDLADYVAFLGEARTQAQARLTDPAARKKLATRLASRAGYETFIDQDPAGRAAWLVAMLDAAEKDQ